MAQLAAFVVDDPVGAVQPVRFREDAAAGRARAEWTWLAEDQGRIVARAVWWGRSESERPLALDCLHVLSGIGDRIAVAGAMLVKAHTAFGVRPDYSLTLHSRQDHDARIRDAVAWRSEAARAAGLTDVVERLRYEWTPAEGLPSPSPRLVFRTASDDEFLAMFREVAVGSLDVATVRDLAVNDAEHQARNDLEFYRSAPGERAWWRLAETRGGEPVGFAIPSATPYHRNVGYLGVLPTSRGHGYVDELLGEITRFHAADGAERITATTDRPNIPMAAAFERANYRMTEVRIVFSAPPG